MKIQYMVEEENTVQNKEHIEVSDGGGNTVQNQEKNTVQNEVSDGGGISKWSSKQKKKRKTLSVLLKLKKKSQPLS